MTEKDQTPYPSIIVSDAGAFPGTVNVHDQATGMTVNAPATPEGMNQAISDLNKFAK